MVRHLNTLFLVLLGIILQVTILPAYLADPFKPNILIIFVVYLGFRADMRFGASAAFLLGLLQDTFSGLYFGLSGFSYLLIYVLFHAMAARLYTESRTLMVLGTFFAVVLNAFVQLALLLLFSVSEGVYVSILEAILPQSFMTSLVAAIVFFALHRFIKEEAP